MPADEPIVRFTIPASSLELRSAGADEPGKGRTVIGVAVPWGETAEIMPGVKERIERGAFDGSEHVLLRTEHGTTIGSVQFRETDTGVEIEAPISRTASGDEAVTLIEDKVWDKLSVGFQALEGGTRVEEDGTYVRTKARLLEVSLTGIPSYLKTTASLREAGHEEPVEKGDNMPDTDVVQLRAEVTELRQANEDFVRRLEALPTNQTPATIPGAQFRSAGEWLKALVDPASREEAMKVVTETRAFLGTALATDTDVKGPTWLADAIRIVNDLSVAIGCFRNAPLPGTGMSMEYLKFGESSLQVQVQSEEGQTLSFGKLSLDTDSASIATYGGYSSLSFQAIRRAPIDVLNTTYELLARQAAIRSNRVFVSLLSGAVTGSYQAVTRHGSATPSIDQWVDSYIDSQIALTDTGLGLPAEGILVSTDVYRTMLRVRDGDYRLVSLPGMTGSGSTSLGTVNLSGGGVGGTVLGFTVRVEPGLPAGTNLMYNRAAATVWGDRTPTRLGPDEDITNLTSEVSVYFLQSQAVQFPTGIVSIKAGV